MREESVYEPWAGNGQISARSDENLRGEKPHRAPLAQYEAKVPKEEADRLAHQKAEQLRRKQEEADRLVLEQEKAERLVALEREKADRLALEEEEAEHLAQEKEKEKEEAERLAALEREAADRLAAREKEEAGRLAQEKEELEQREAEQLRKREEKETAEKAINRAHPVFAFLSELLPDGLFAQVNGASPLEDALDALEVARTKHDKDSIKRDPLRRLIEKTALSSSVHNSPAEDLAAFLALPELQSVLLGQLCEALKERIKNLELSEEDLKSLTSRTLAEEYMKVAPLTVLKSFLSPTFLRAAFGKFVIISESQLLETLSKEMNEDKFDAHFCRRTKGSLFRIEIPPPDSRLGIFLKAKAIAKDDMPPPDILVKIAESKDLSYSFLKGFLDGLAQKKQEDPTLSISSHAISEVVTGAAIQASTLLPLVEGLPEESPFLKTSSVPLVQRALKDVPAEALDIEKFKDALKLILGNTPLEKSHDLGYYILYKDLAYSSANMRTFKSLRDRTDFVLDLVTTYSPVLSFLHPSALDELFKEAGYDENTDPVDVAVAFLREGIKMTDLGYQRKAAMESFKATPVVYNALVHLKDEVLLLVFLKNLAGEIYKLELKGKKEEVEKMDWPSIQTGIISLVVKLEPFVSCFKPQSGEELSESKSHFFGINRADFSEEVFWKALLTKLQYKDFDLESLRELILKKEILPPNSVVPSSAGLLILKEVAKGEFMQVQHQRKGQNLGCSKPGRASLDMLKDVTQKVSVFFPVFAALRAESIEPYLTLDEEEVGSIDFFENVKTNVLESIDPSSLKEPEHYTEFFGPEFETMMEKDGFFEDVFPEYLRSFTRAVTSGSKIDTKDSAKALKKMLFLLPVKKCIYNNFPQSMDLSDPKPAADHLKPVLESLTVKDFNFGYFKNYFRNAFGVEGLEESCPATGLLMLKERARMLLLSLKKDRSKHYDMEEFKKKLDEIKKWNSILNLFNAASLSETLQISKDSYEKEDVLAHCIRYIEGDTKYEDLILDPASGHFIPFPRMTDGLASLLTGLHDQYKFLLIPLFVRSLAKETRRTSLDVPPDALRLAAAEWAMANHEFLSAFKWYLNKELVSTPPGGLLEKAPKETPLENNFNSGDFRGPDAILKFLMGCREILPKEGKPNKKDFDLVRAVVIPALLGISVTLDSFHSFQGKEFDFKGRVRASRACKDLPFKNNYFHKELEGSSNPRSKEVARMYLQAVVPSVIIVDEALSTLQRLKEENKLSRYIGTDLKSVLGRLPLGLQRNCILSNLENFVIKTVTFLEDSGRIPSIADAEEATSRALESFLESKPNFEDDLSSFRAQNQETFDELSIPPPTLSAPKPKASGGVKSKALQPADTPPSSLKPKSLKEGTSRSNATPGLPQKQKRVKSSPLQPKMR